MHMAIDNCCSLLHEMNILEIASVRIERSTENSADKFPCTVRYIGRYRRYDIVPVRSATLRKEVIPCNDGCKYNGMVLYEKCAARFFCTAVTLSVVHTGGRGLSHSILSLRLANRV